MEKRLQFRRATVQPAMSLAFKKEMTIFCFVCRAEVNIAAEKRPQFRHRHRQYNPWLGPRGYVRESTMLQLVGALPSIQFFSAIMITIQQDCVSPLEERLSGSQDSWSRQHNRLPSLGSMSGRMVVWKESRAWHGFASVFYLVFCLFFQWLSVWRTW